MVFIASLSDWKIFLPWSGSGSLFYGHPGGMNFLYFLFSKFFWNDLQAARLFCLIMSSLCIFFYYLLLKFQMKPLMSALAASSLLILPMFQVQSLLFLNEYGSYALAFASLVAYQKNKMGTYAALMSMAVFYLESALSYALAIIFIEFLQTRKSIRAFICLKNWALFTPILLLLFFFLTKSFGVSEPFTHNTQDLVLRRLSRPPLIYSEINWSNWLRARSYTFTENLPFSVTFLIIMLPILGWMQKIKWPHFIQILFFASITQFVFFSFLSVDIGGRDFFGVFCFLFATSFFVLGGFRQGLAAATVIFMALSAFSWSRLTSGQASWFQTTLREYSNQNFFLEIKQQIENQPGNFICYPNIGYLSKAFCTDQFLSQAENFQVGRDKSQLFMAIMPEHDEHGFSRISDKFTYKGKINLGKFHKENIIGVIYTQSN